MKIDILESSGFCGGVVRAIRLLDDVIKSNSDKKIYMLGEIVHNKIVSDKYKNLGVIIINESELDHLKDGSIVISSAHGISLKLREKLKRFNHIDSTCPFVKKNQNMILSDREENLLFAGKKNHQEAVALTMDKNIPIIENVSDLKEMDLKKGGIYCQTTFNEDELNKIYDYIKEKSPSFVLHNTLCETTIKNQNALKYVDSRYNVCIIVGDKHSNNAVSLYELSKYERTYFISNENEINKDDFHKEDSILLIGSASTPKEEMENVKNKLLSLF